MNNHKPHCQMSAKGWAATLPPVCTCEGNSQNGKPFVPQGEEERPAFLADEKWMKSAKKVGDSLREKEKNCKGCKNGTREGCYNGCGEEKKYNHNENCPTLNCEIENCMTHHDCSKTCSLPKEQVIQNKCQHTGTPKDIVGCEICHPKDKLNPPIISKEHTENCEWICSDPRNHLILKEQTESWEEEIAEIKTKAFTMMGQYARYSSYMDKAISFLLQKAKAENPQLQSIKEYGERRAKQARAEVVAEIVKEIEGMKKFIDETEHEKLKFNEQCVCDICDKVSYNEALNDIIHLLSENYK